MRRGFSARNGCVPCYLFAVTSDAQALVRVTLAARTPLEVETGLFRLEGKAPSVSSATALHRSPVFHFPQFPQSWSPSTASAPPVSPTAAHSDDASACSRRSAGIGTRATRTSQSQCSSPTASAANVRWAAALSIGTTSTAGACAGAAARRKRGCRTLTSTRICAAAATIPSSGRSQLERQPACMFRGLARGPSSYWCACQHRMHMLSRETTPDACCR